MASVDRSKKDITLDLILMAAGGAATYVGATQGLNLDAYVAAPIIVGGAVIPPYLRNNYFAKTNSLNTSFIGDVVAPISAASVVSLLAKYFQN